MAPNTSRDIPGPEPRKDSARDQEKAAVRDGAKSDQQDRDRVHGDGKGIGIARK